MGVTTVQNLEALADAAVGLGVNPRARRLHRGASQCLRMARLQIARRLRRWRALRTFWAKMFQYSRSETEQARVNTWILLPPLPALCKASARTTVFYNWIAL